MEITPNGIALFRYPEYDDVTRKLNHDVPGIVVETLHPYAFDMGQPHYVVRGDDGREMAVRVDQLTPLDAGVLEMVTRGFVRAMLWSDAQPLAPYGVQHDGQSWRVLHDGVVMDGESHPTFEDAAKVCERLNAEDDDYTGESGGLENCEPSAGLVAKVREICARFVQAAGDDDLDAFMDAFGDPDGGHPGEYVGHTFYLTAGGHGVSFTDRAWRDDDPMTAVCERLETVARTFGEVEHLDAYQLEDGSVTL